MNGEYMETSQPETYKPTSESILQKIEEVNSDVKAWNSLNRDFKGKNIQRAQWVLPPDVVDDDLQIEIRLSGGLPKDIANDDEALYQLDQKIEDAVAPLRERGVIRRNNTEYSPKYVPEYEDFDAPIEGLLEQSDLILAIDEHTTRQRINQIPTYFRRNIDDIRFIPTDEIPPYDSLETTDPDENEIHKQAIDYELMQTVYHEIFENASKHLSLDEMQAWNNAVKEDTEQRGILNISEYSRIMTAMEGKGAGNKEDFCDSAAEFFLRPYDLQLAAPARFNCLLELTAKHVPETERQTYINNVYQKMAEGNKQREFLGQSENDVIERFAAHNRFSDEDIRQWYEEESQNGDGPQTTVGNHFTTSIEEDGAVRGRIEIYISPYINKPSKS